MEEDPIKLKLKGEDEESINMSKEQGKGNAFYRNIIVSLDPLIPVQWQCRYTDRFSASKAEVKTLSTRGFLCRRKMRDEKK